MCASQQTGLSDTIVVLVNESFETSKNQISEREQQQERTQSSTISANKNMIILISFHY